MNTIWKKIIAYTLIAAIGFSGNALPGSVETRAEAGETQMWEDPLAPFLITEETQRLRVGIRLQESDQVTVSQGGIYIVTIPKNESATMICTMPVSMPAIKNIQFELFCNTPTPASVQIISKNREADAKQVKPVTQQEITAASGAGISMPTPSALLTVEEEYRLDISCDKLKTGLYQYFIKATDKDNAGNVYESDTVTIDYQGAGEPENPAVTVNPGGTQPGAAEDPGTKDPEMEQPGQDNEKQPEDSDDPENDENEEQIAKVITGQSIQVGEKGITCKKIIKEVKGYYESYGKKVTITNKDITLSNTKAAVKKGKKITGIKYGEATIKIKVKIKGEDEKTTLDEIQIPLTVTPGKPALKFIYDPKNKGGKYQVWSLQISKLDKNIIKKVKIQYGIDKGKDGKKTTYLNFGSVKSKKIKKGTYVTRKFQANKAIKYRFKVTVVYKQSKKYKYDSVENDGIVKK